MHIENLFFEATVGLSPLSYKFLFVIWVPLDQSLWSWFVWNWREELLTFSNIFTFKTFRTNDVPRLTSLRPKIPSVCFTPCTISLSKDFSDQRKCYIWQGSRQAHSVCLRKFSLYHCCKREAIPSRTHTKLHQDSRNLLPENVLLSWSFPEACTQDFHRNCRLCHLRRSNLVLPTRNLQFWCAHQFQQEYFMVWSLCK